MNVTKLTEHQIRNLPAEEVKDFVDSGEYDPWDLSPLKIEKKPLDIADYNSICGRYVVKRFRTIDDLIEFLHEEQDSSELETSGEASLPRHPELEEPSLERTPRSWEDWARPRHPELDSDSEDGLDTRPGIVVL